jgi:hypothetical protein
VSQYWTTTQLINRVRQLIGLPQIWQIADAEIISRINDFYQTKLPVRLKPDEFDSTYRFQTVGAYQIATGDGKTKTWGGMLTTVPGVCGVGFSDSVETFKCDESGKLWGTLGGTGTLTGALYSLTFNTASPVGAQIGVYYDTYTLPDSVVTVQAPAVVAGYPVALVEDVETFWSHWPMYQPYYMGGASPPIYMPNLPQEALLYDSRLTVRPVPDQAYLFESAAVLKPKALDTVSSNILKDLWGPYIALEVSVEYLLETGDEEGASPLIEQRSEAMSDCITPVIVQKWMRRAKGAW